VDAGGENIWIDHNEGKIYRNRPRYNEKVNKWWISDETRYSWRDIQGINRLRAPRKAQYGAQVETTLETALHQALTELKSLGSTPGSLYAVLSPMMSNEEAYLLGKLIRSLDAQAMLILGPVPTGPDETFKNYLNGKQTFVIKGEKVPNAAGVRRILELLGGPTATYDLFVKSETPEFKKLKGGWIVGGYLKEWLPKDQPPMFKKGFRVVQDIFPNALVNVAEVVIPGAAWCEKDGSWENYQNIIQVFNKAVPAPEGVLSEADVYFRALKRTGIYSAEAIRKEMGGVFAEAAIPSADVAKQPEMEFVEL
jgi:NADH-quinone oxidoreductase subunit G